jgi:hypothetical protein
MMFVKIPVGWQAVLKLLEAITLVTQLYISEWHQVLTKRRQYAS